MSNRAETIRNIIEEGIVLKPLSFGKSREKAFGAMYMAYMTILYHNMILFFDMWHHHSSEQLMTEDEVLDNIDLKGLKIENKYYDLYWYSRWFGDRFFLHPDGWFGFEPTAKELEKAVRRLEDIEYGDTVEKELLELGFKHIPEIDQLKRSYN